MQTVDVKITKFEDYIGYDQFKLIKLHGSINWGAEVESERTDPSVQHNAWQFAERLTRDADKISISKCFHFYSGNIPMVFAGDKVISPAIAIPVEAKGQFVCPDAHIQCVTGAISDVSRVLTIGWRAQDRHFLELIKSKQKDKIQIQVVAADKRSAEEVIGNLNMSGIDFDGHPFNGGFSDYAVSREAENFLA